jgi:hypothetical protein
MRTRSHHRTFLAAALAGLTSAALVSSALAQTKPPAKPPATPSATPAAAPPPATPAAAPPPGFAPAPTPPPGYAPPPAGAPPGDGPPPQPPYPYPYPYAPPVYPQQPSRDWEARQREAADDWQPGEPVPDGYRKVTGIRKGLVIGGSVTWGSVYLFNAAAAASLHDTEQQRFDPLYVPAIGPFITIATARPDSLGALGLVLDGLVQSGGLAMMIIGLVSPQIKLVRDRSPAAVLPVPFLPDTRTAGLGLVGAF